MTAVLKPSSTRPKAARRLAGDGVRVGLGAVLAAHSEGEILHLLGAAPSF